MLRHCIISYFPQTVTKTVESALGGEGLLFQLMISGDIRSAGWGGLVAGAGSVHGSQRELAGQFADQKREQGLKPDADVTQGPSLVTHFC